jgi:hypothetical protein
MPKALKTNTSKWTAVFRAIVQQLKNDPDVKRVIGLDNLRTWDGSPGDKMAFAPTNNRPVVRLTPQPRNVEWYSPDMQAGRLYVQVELAVQSLCIDDVLDLWDLILYPIRPGATNAAGSFFFLDLTAVGAETGEIVFSDPAFDPQPGTDQEGFFLASGHFHLTVQRFIG